MSASMNDLPNDSFQDLSFDNSINGSGISQPCVMSNPSDPSYDSLISVSPSRSNVVCVSSARDYSLNIDKVLKKKIAAYRQVMAEYKCIGGGITGRMDTAAFDFFRSACSKLYREFPLEEGFCKIVDSDDRKGKAVAQHTFRVSRTVGENQIGYTVNLYPTNNRLLINGKDVDRFMDNYLPLLLT